jgi:hypothetical protein
VQKNLTAASWASRRAIRAELIGGQGLLRSNAGCADQFDQIRR